LSKIVPFPHQLQLSLPEDPCQEAYIARLNAARTAEEKHAIALEIIRNYENERSVFIEKMRLFFYYNERAIGALTENRD
jgi:hypothetical protein